MDRCFLVIAFGLLLLLDASLVLAGPIHEAARSGNVERIERLLDQGADLEERNVTHETPLISAALAGQLVVAQVLVVKGAAIHARNNRGLTPLHAAAYGLHLLASQTDSSDILPAPASCSLLPPCPCHRRHRSAITQPRLCA